MRVVFFGTPVPAVASMHALSRAGHELVTVVTRPDRPAGRSRLPAAPPVKVAASEQGLPVLQPRRPGDREFLERLARAGAELFVVVAYGRILGPELLALARRGVVNVHFSLLPAYRGAAPVQWALARGETVTGVTTMRVNERLDEGDILLQRTVPIEAGEHAPALQRRLAVVGGELLVETVERMAGGRLDPRRQDPAAASVAPRLRVEDGVLDPRLPARKIEGRVRGFDPWPGVWGKRHGTRLRLVEARALDAPPRSEPAGTLVEPGRFRIALVCGEGTLLELLRVQPQGRRVLDAREALNGRQLAAGDVLE